MKKLLRLTIMIAMTALIFLSNAQAQDWRSLTVGRLQMGQDKQGAHWMSSTTSDGQMPVSLAMNWQPWPSYENDLGYHGVDINNETNIERHGKTLVGQCSWWAGAQNWDSPPAGNWGPDGIEALFDAGHYDMFISDNGPVTLSSLIDTPDPDFVPTKHYRRVDMPVVKIDDAAQQPVAFDPSGNSYSINPDLVTDGMLEAQWTHPLGLTFNDKWYAWTNPDYEKIIIVETTITNSGDVNMMLDGIEKPGQSLENLWIGVKHQIAGVQSYLDFGSFEQYDGIADWLLEYDPVQRYYWTWDGDAADIEGDDQFDPRGGPIGSGVAELPTGEFTAPEVCGFAFLYISNGAEPSADNPDQPATFRYVNYDDHLSPVADKKLAEAWNWMTGADGKDMYMTGWGDTPYAPQEKSQPHWDPIFGVGPYNLASGESIKLVYCYAVGSIDEARAIELGKAVKDGNMDLATAKQEIYEDGRDDLFAQFEKGKDLYFNKNLSAPFPPDPPNMSATSGPEINTIEWETVSGANLYRVYRAVGGVDNGRVYNMITETTGTSYVDEDVTKNFNYYYYVTAVDGNDLESSHFFNRVNKAVVPFARGTQASDWADQVRVVPNPINIRGNTYKSDQPHNSTGYNYDGDLRDQNTVAFVNLPEYCTIKIYNSVGDEIKELNHTTGSANERWWPIITDDNQFPASGVYFYTIEVTQGPLSGQVGTGKLVIIR